MRTAGNREHADKRVAMGTLFQISLIGQSLSNKSKDSSKVSLWDIILLVPWAYIKKCCKDKSYLPYSCHCLAKSPLIHTYHT